MTRGSELVQAAITNANAQWSSGRKKRKHTPLAPALAKRLHFAGKRKVPASLVEWLGFDTDWLELEIKKTGEIASEPIAEALDWRFPDLGPWDDFQTLLPEPVVMLPIGSDSCHLLYLGKTDEFGEYPIFVIDTDDTPYATIYSPGFDVWIAEAWDAIPGWHRDTYEAMWDHREYGKAIRKHAKLNFHGLESYDIQDGLPGKLQKKAPKKKTQSAKADGKKAKASKKQKFELPPEVIAQIDKAVKRKKNDLDRIIAALEATKKALKRLDDDNIKAVARHLDEDPDYVWGVSFGIR